MKGREIEGEREEEEGMKDRLKEEMRRRRERLLGWDGMGWEKFPLPSFLLFFLLSTTSIVVMRRGSEKG